MRTPAGVVLDVGATAKAWAADRAAMQPRGPAAAVCSSASAATSPRPVRPPTAAGRSASPTTIAATPPPRARRSRSPPAASQRPARPCAAGATTAPDAPHPRPAHRRARASRLAHRECRRRHLRRGQHRYDRGDRTRRWRGRVAVRRSAYPPVWSTRAGRVRTAGRLAARPHARRCSLMRPHEPPPRDSRAQHLLVPDALNRRRGARPAHPRDRPRRDRRAALELARWPRFVVDSLHRNVSLLAVGFLLFHILTAVLDSFAPISLLDSVIPFHGTYRSSGSDWARCRST